MIASSASAAPPEFSPPFPNPFKSASGKSTLQTISKIKIKCLADTNVGEIIGPNALTVTIGFTGCELKKVPCNSPNGLTGEIVTSQLVGKPGYIVNPAIKEVGVDLSTATGAPLMEFTCTPGTRAFVVGSVIGKITPVNKMVKPPGHFTLAFKQKNGKQVIANLFAEPPDVLSTSFGGPLEESGLSSTDKITLAAPMTVIA